MTAGSYAIALLSVSLSLVTAAGVVGLAIEKDHRSEVETFSVDACPPGACTVVAKTTVGGPPSELRNVAGAAFGRTDVASLTP